MTCNRPGLLDRAIRADPRIIAWVQEQIHSGADDATICRRLAWPAVSGRIIERYRVLVSNVTH
jgi:hypothetical protein